ITTGIVTASGITITSGGNLILGGNISGGGQPVALTATSGNLTQTSGSITSSSKVILGTSGGNIGTSTAMRTVTPLLFVSSFGSANVANTGTLSVGNSSAGGLLKLASTGALNVD